MNGIKTEIKQFFKSIGDMNVPEIVRTKFNTFLLLSALTALIGILSFFLMKTGIIVIPVTLIIAFVILMYGITYKYSVIKHGYVIKRGICIDHLREFTVGNIGKAADAVVIETDDEVINLPVTGRSNIPPIGTTVEIYVSNNSAVYSYNGRNNYSTIYGYEVVPG